jgi:uncharacterized OB-fold protein
MTIGPVSRDASTAVFFDGTAAGEFRLRRCRECGGSSVPQAGQCEHCGATELDWQAAGGGASVVSWTVTHPQPADGGPAAQRTVLVIAQFDEGPWWWGQLVEADPASPRVGTRLRICFERPGGDSETEAVPVFRLAH